MKAKKNEVVVIPRDVSERIKVIVLKRDGKFSPGDVAGFSQQIVDRFIEEGKGAPYADYAKKGVIDFKGLMHDFALDQEELAALARRADEQDQNARTAPKREARAQKDTDLQVAGMVRRLEIFRAQSAPMSAGKR